MNKLSVGAASFLLLAAWILPAAADTKPNASAPAAIDFNRDIRPILSNNCFACHGPDAETREAGLRLDEREAALAVAPSGTRAVVPGKPGESELLKRVLSRFEDVVMPPPDSDKKLSATEKDLLKRWIAEGARWGAHWSFTPIARPQLPKNADAAWPRNPIDQFILARLNAEDLRPSPEADKETLIRRVTLDLTGLPPTPAEVDAFLADKSPTAYESLVDRLLGSPRYGERMALDWLDASRFADTHGYHIDSGRDMSRWREWVIDAFNRNLPFDQFTVDQLAGDLQPKPTTAQRIASGFNRNHMINFEGGAIPAEYHSAYIVDRVNTTSTVWLGLTVACAQCHDHKYDAITQKEYYQLYAFFHNVPENGLDGRTGNAPPLVKLPTPEQERKQAELTASIQQVETRINAEASQLATAVEQWEKSRADAGKTEWIPLEPIELTAKQGSVLRKLEDRTIVADGPNPPTECYTLTAPIDLTSVTAIRLETLPDERLTAKGPGRSENGNLVLTGVRVSVAPAPGAKSGAAGEQVKLKAATADFSQQGFPVSHALDESPATGWAIHPEVGKPHFAIFELEQPLAGKDKPLLTVSLEFLSQYSRHQPGRFRISATSSAKPHASDALPANIVAILAVDPAKRTDAQKNELTAYYRTNVSAELKQLDAQLAALKKERDELDRQTPSAMVMEEMPQPRETFMLVRGQYDKPGEKVTAATPASLPALPSGVPPNRLGFARWLVDPSHPLTARVAVNRYWQAYFGTGLVKTSEDFGSQGDLPSHPELLDWLSAEFIASGWDVKRMQRLIVTSATYRQSSRATPEMLAKDPENRLLARGARFRLPAEFIRDQALAVSGLLDPRIGGHSVSPYQPPGLWEELASRQDGANWTAQTYVQSHGADLYRRTMYTFWKRTSPPPTLSTFDAPDREICTVRRARTNTPLQALVLMNDPTYLEASRKLAERLMTEGGSTPEERITLAIRLTMARRPRPAEIAVLRRIFDEQLAVFRKDNAAAVKLLSVGEAPRNEKLDVAELAAWTTVGSVILNLDETVTKG